jgi:hypothetical protein
MKFQDDTVAFRAVENMTITHTASNPHFSVIPKMFEGDDPSVLQCYEDLMESESMVTFIDRYHQDLKHDIFYWIMLRQQRLRRRFRLSELSQYLDMKTICSRTLYFLHFHQDIEYAVVTQSLGMHNLMFYNERWAKRMLCRYPYLIDRVSEHIIQYFFSHNSTWFLHHLIREHPSVLDFIHVDMNDDVTME